MRNLRNVHCTNIATDKPSVQCWDAGSDSIICAIGPTEHDDRLELRRWRKFASEFEYIAGWAAPCPSPDLLRDTVIDIHHFADAATTCLVLEGGDLILVREKAEVGEDKVEIVGSVDAGIAAASWSPDEELLAIVTKASTLLYMTREFDNVVDLTLTSTDLDASNHVSVGWGKKETQFKGKKARVLQDPTMPSTIDNGDVDESDTRMIGLSWRGDGEFLAVNAIEGLRRVIRVYSREGTLDSVSEPVDNLLGALSWRPAGNLIASIQRVENVVKVVFFERNGLRHGEFQLRVTPEELHSWASEITLRWNSDSTILAVSFKDRIQFWTMGNYHYYLKQEIQCAPTTSNVPRVAWHPEKAQTVTFCGIGGITRLSYSSGTPKSPSVAPNDFATAPVIDGKTLKITPLRIANVPPPMALHELVMDDNITDVASMTTKTSQTETSTYIVVLSTTTLSLYTWPKDKMKHEKPRCSWRIALDAVKGTMARQVAIYQSAEGERHIAILIGPSQLRVYDMNGQSIERQQSSIEDHIDLLASGVSDDSPLACIINQTKQFGPTVTIQDGTYQFRTAGQNLDAVFFKQRSNSRDEDQPQMSNGTHGSALNENPAIGNSKYIFFRHDDKANLFANDRCLLKNCTSFLVSLDHLIVTTSQHLLKFIHLQRDVEALEIPSDLPEVDERCRSIERGARLVAVVPSTFALIMQMPRGNIETIYPRALVLAGIRRSISEKDYKKAFLACRSHRVDMNLLHDHMPGQFLSHIGLFIDTVKRPDYLDLFLSSLKGENVSCTIYRETLPSMQKSHESVTQDNGINATTSSKTNRICEAFLKELNDRPEQYLQNMISAHVCKSPPDLISGLRQIARLRAKKSDKVDLMVEHICFLADVNRLYEDALGSYDIDLALLIAQQSQKDPREYLPFLQKAHSASELRRRFTIDDYLKRYTKALNHLCEMDELAEVKAYMVKHDLYTQAMETYRYRDEIYSELLRLNASHLQQQHKYKDAGIAYEYLHEYQSASECYRHALLWKEALFAAEMGQVDKAGVRSLATVLANTLMESKNYLAAGTIRLDYLDDVEAAVTLLCKGYFFADAFRIASLHHRLDLLETAIDRGLAEGMASMTELLSDCKTQLNAQVPRIRELRQKKAEDPLAFWEGDIPGGGDVPDDISVASTNASTTGGSLFTRYTNRTGTVGTNATRKTSKNRRRDERKRARGKKGSVYEEEYLVNSVGRLMERINASQGDVSRLVVGLLRRRMREYARAVQSAMVEVVDLCKNCHAEVFVVDEKYIKALPQALGPLDGSDQHESRFESGEDAMEDSIVRIIPPVIADFEKLSLV